MNEPFFSVIVPTYNRAAFLERCISSVVNQHCSDWELLIIDDGSTDNTNSVVSKYMQEDSRIKYFYQKNRGVSAARNLGLKMAAGKYLCFLDSDDEYSCQHLKFFHDHLRKEGLPKAFLSTGFTYKDSYSATDVLSPEIKTYPDPLVSKIMSAYLPFSPCVQTICLPATIKDHVRFDERLALSECYDFCARAAALVDSVIYFPFASVTLYGHDNNASVPNNTEERLRFNSRQYEEFQLMSQDPFYRSIVKTKAFKHRMFFLQMEVAKSSMKQKNIGQSAGSFLKALRYNPSFLLRADYGKLLRKFTVRKSTVDS